MRGTKPEQSVEAASQDALSNLRLHTPSSQEASISETQQGVQGSSAKNASVQRFEKILEQELSGTSFSRKLDARAKIQQERSVGIDRNKVASNRPLNGAKSALRPVRRAELFVGATILDKLVSFIANLIKALERKLLGAFGRFLPGRRQSVQAQKQLKALTDKKEQLKKLKQGQSGPAVK